MYYSEKILYLIISMNINGLLILQNETIMTDFELQIYNKNILFLKNIYYVIENIIFSNINILNTKYKKFCIKLNYFDIFNIIIIKIIYGHTYDSIIDLIYEKF